MAVNFRLTDDANFGDSLKQLKLAVEICTRHFPFFFVFFLLQIDVLGLKIDIVADFFLIIGVCLSEFEPR